MSRNETIRWVMDTRGGVTLTGAAGSVELSAEVAREIAAAVNEHRGAVQRGDVLGRLALTKTDPPKPTFDDMPEPERSMARALVERGVVAVAVSVSDADRERLADAGKLVREWTVRTPMGVPIMTFSHEPTDDELRTALERAEYRDMDEVDEGTEIDDLEVGVSYWLSPAWKAALLACVAGHGKA